MAGTTRRRRTRPRRLIHDHVVTALERHWHEELRRTTERRRRHTQAVRIHTLAVIVATIGMHVSIISL